MTEEEKPKPADDDFIKKANAAAERLEAANREAAKLVLRAETAKVEAKLGGTADAGSQEETPDQRANREARKLLEGTGYEDILGE
jgi:hypothetical protein